MYISSLYVSNFRAISCLQIRDLPAVVVIAGPNGCGKSCIFDAIRLIKSVYGGYQPNEWQHWMSEFNINVHQRQHDLLTLLQNRRKALTINMNLRLADDEKGWLQEKAGSLISERLWKSIAPELTNWRNINATPLAAQLRVHEPAVQKQAKSELPALLAEMEQPELVADLTIEPDGSIRTKPSRALEIIFSIYEPQSIGVIDYHGAQRTYNREQIGGINLNIETSEHQLSQHALYNYANKYGNIKSELAASYIRELLGAKAGEATADSAGLNETLRELFSTFFPGKQFLGPEPTKDGRLLFNVRTSNGAIHDINDLSSGEKEVLYGYLRLRNSSPRNSVLLIDEPELHLNPRLIQGLPQFYRKHLGKSLNNQLWLVTHSDTLLRQAVGQPEFRIFHMQSPGSQEASLNQAKEIAASHEVEKLVIELVGDLAAYRPGAKIVVLEGGGDSDFDVRMVSQLFPELLERLNLISGGNKQRVRELHDLLEEARRRGGIPGQFYSISDLDFDSYVEQVPGRAFTWDRFHIENYLLEPAYILRALTDLDIQGSKDGDAGAIEESLREAAMATLPSLVRHHLEKEANQALVECIKTKTNPKEPTVADPLFRAVNGSLQRISETISGKLSLDKLRELERHYYVRFSQDLSSGAWRNTFRGRDVLKIFAGDLTRKIGYETLRNLVIARMRDDHFQPAGMKFIIEKILSDPIT